MIGQDLDSPFDALRKATTLGAPATDALAREAAAQSIVLLSNQGGATLPLALGQTGTLALVGPHSNTSTALLGMYVGHGNKLIEKRDARTVLTRRLGAGIFPASLPAQAHAIRCDAMRRLAKVQALALLLCASVRFRKQEGLLRPWPPYARQH